MGMSGKRIAILVAGLPPVYNGGTEIATVDIAKFAVRAGHDVHLIAADGTRRGALLYNVGQNGYKVHRVPTVSIPYIYGLYYMPYAIKEVVKLKPDLVHAQGMYMGVSAFWANTLFKFPYLIYSRGEMYMNWPFKRLAAKIIMSRADRVVAQTEDMRVCLQSILNRDVEVIPNGIDISRFKTISKSEARTKLRLLPNMRFVLFVGRARPEKNLMGFVRVMDMLRSRGDCCGLVLGDGQQLNSAKRLAESLGLNNIIFRGNVNNEDVPLYMYASDVLLNTSISEGFPVVFLEAMACGLPIVAPRIGGISEIVVDGKNGILVSPKDVEASALAVNTLLNSNGMVKFMTRNNLKRSRGYSWESVVEKLYG